MNNSPKKAIYGTVILSTRAIVTLLTLFWTMSTSHCLLEGAGILESDECCKTDTASSQPSGHSCETSCSSLEDGNYRLPTTKYEILVPATVSLPAEGLPVSPEPPRVSTIVTASPPELCCSWQFISRAALPARAPSIAS